MQINVLWTIKMWPFKKNEVTNASVQNNVQEITELEQLADLFGLPMGDDQVTVTPKTALRVTACLACVRIIASNIASMPIKVYEKTDSGRREALEHPAHALLHTQPNPLYTPFTFWESIVCDILLKGDGYAEIVRRGRLSTEVEEYRFIANTSCSVVRKKDHLVYKITDEHGTRTVHQDDMIHIPGFGFNGKNGLSVIQNNEAISTAIQADKFSNKFFKNGTHLGGYLKFQNKLSAETAKATLDYFIKKFQGANNAFSPAILSEGGEYVPLSINANDAQIIETRRYQVADIARIFGVPLFMINETEKSTSWGTGIEQQSIGFVRYTLQPHLTRIAQEINRKVFRDNQYFCEHYTNAIMKGDTKARNESYQISLGGNQQPGWMTINEVRKLENLPPVVGGDSLYKPLTGEVEENEEATEPDQE